MIKRCDSGHNEVAWVQENHSQGCPVCAQIARMKGAPMTLQEYMMRESELMLEIERYGEALQKERVENQTLTCKLRDANIEIKKLQQISYDMGANLAASQGEIEKLKADILKMRKQRDDLLVENESLLKKQMGMETHIAKLDIIKGEQRRDLARLNDKIEELAKIPEKTLASSFTKEFDLVQKQVHVMAKDRGWWDDPRTDAECICLIHSELSEALEYMRSDNKFSDHIPEFLGVVEELADAIIRAMDMSQYHGWKLSEAIIAKIKFNATRERRHGKKF